MQKTMMGKTAVAVTATALIATMGLVPLSFAANENVNANENSEQVQNDNAAADENDGQVENDNASADENVNSNESADENSEDGSNENEQAESEADGDDDADGEESDEEKENIVIDEEKLSEIASASRHNYQSRSELPSSFKIFNSGVLKGVWGAVEDLATMAEHNTWISSGDMLYTYWYETVDASGNSVIGGAEKTDEAEVEITAEQAKSAFERYIDHFDWDKMELTTDPDMDPTKDVETACEMKEDATVEINGYTAIRYVGELTRSDVTFATYAYVILDGDTASWVTVSYTTPQSGGMSANEKLERKADGAAHSYRSPQIFLHTSGAIFDTSTPKTEESSTVLSDDGSTIIETS